EAREDEIERSGLERIGRRVADLEAGVVELVLARRADQPLGNIDSQHTALRTDLLGELGRRRPRAAAGGEHLLARLGRRRPRRGAAGGEWPKGVMRRWMRS